MTKRPRTIRGALPQGSSQLEFDPPREFEGVSHKDVGDLRERLAILETKVSIGIYLLGALITALIGVAIAKIWDKIF